MPAKLDAAILIPCTRSLRDRAHAILNKDAGETVAGLARTLLEREIRSREDAGRGLHAATPRPDRFALLELDGATPAEPAAPPAPVRRTRKVAK